MTYGSLDFHGMIVEEELADGGWEGVVLLVVRGLWSCEEKGEVRRGSWTPLLL